MATYIGWARERGVDAMATYKMRLHIFAARVSHTFFAIYLT